MKSQQLLVLDGKALKEVSWKVKDQPLYPLNAWDLKAKKFFGQLTIEEKINETTVASQLLKSFNLDNTIVTVNAIMTQKEIAHKMIDKPNFPQELYLCYRRNQSIL